jgi:hypothetical protein
MLKNSKDLLVLFRTFRLSKYLTRINIQMYFAKHETKDKMCYTEDEAISMLEFIIGNIVFEFRWRMLQQIIVIPMETDCVPLFVELFF